MQHLSIITVFLFFLELVKFTEIIVKLKNAILDSNFQEIKMIFIIKSE